MIFSKSFGYTTRGILFIASMQAQKQYVQVEEIAVALCVPRHFMGKILKMLAKEKILSSVKGPSGGFTINERTLKVTLIDLLLLTDGSLIFDRCVMRLRECNSSRPCPMHNQIEPWRDGLQAMLSQTTIKDLLRADMSEFVRSLSDVDSIDH